MRAHTSNSPPHVSVSKMSEQWHMRTCWPLFFALAALNVVFTSALEEYVKGNGTCYFISDLLQVDYPKAVAICQGKSPNGKLLEPQNRSMELPIEDILLNATNFWIGVNDISHEGVFVFESTGLTAPYSPWGPKQPNGATVQNCLTISSTDAGVRLNRTYWFDTTCTKIRGVICDISDTPYMCNPTTAATIQPTTAKELTTLPGTSAAAPSTQVTAPPIATQAPTLLMNPTTAGASSAPISSPPTTVGTQQLPTFGPAQLTTGVPTTPGQPPPSPHNVAAVTPMATTGCLALTSARQRSTFNDAAAAKAIDSDPKTCSVTGRERASWLKIQLGCQTTLTSVTIEGRGVGDIEVRVGNSDDRRGYRGGAQQTGNVVCTRSHDRTDMKNALLKRTLSCDSPVTGQFVYIVSLSSSHRHMTLCDVTVA